MNAAIARAISRVLDTLRAKAAGSVAIRALLIGALAVSVTIGGVMAGALVVAPVVARATRPDAAQQTSKLVASVSSGVRTVARTVLDRTRTGARGVLMQMPAPVARFAVPGLAMLSIFSAMVALLMRRQPPTNALALATTDVGAPLRPTAKLTPRSIGRTSSSRSKTPRAVEALAASGASAPDIAWRTGLPLDAVQLLLAISTGARQLQPTTA